MGVPRDARHAQPSRAPLRDYSRVIGRTSLRGFATRKPAGEDCLRI
jgi:hypothetical protein